MIGCAHVVLCELVTPLLGNTLRGPAGNDQHAAIGQEQHVVVRLQDRRVIAITSRRRPFQPAVEQTLRSPYILNN